MRPTSVARSTLGVALEGFLVLAILAAMVVGAGVLANGTPGDASSALAAKGGNGRGHSTLTAVASVTASPPEAAAWGTRIDVNGCGYAFAPVELRVVHATGAIESYMVGVWNTGCMAGTYFTTQEPGTYGIEVYQNASLVASSSVNVN